MATITPEQLPSEVSFNRRFLIEEMGDDDQGEAIVVRNRPDGSIQAIGTFASATVTLEGSNDGTNWVTLTDPAGDPVTLTTAGLVMFLPRTWKIRVTTSGGSGTDVDVFILLGG